MQSRERIGKHDRLEKESFRVWQPDTSCPFLVALDLDLFDSRLTCLEPRILSSVSK